LIYDGRAPTNTDLFKKETERERGQAAREDRVSVWNRTALFSEREKKKREKVRGWLVSKRCPPFTTAYTYRQLSFNTRAGGKETL